MRQFILPESFKGEELLVIDGEDFHYMCNVLRKKVNDSFPGLDIKGDSWNLTINSIENNKCTLKTFFVSNKEFHGTEITLIQCLPKGKKMDLIIRQAVEAGVKRIIPLQSDFAIPHFDNEKDMGKKRLRWEKIAIEAMQQSGSSVIPKIFPPMKMDQLEKIRNNEGLALFFHQEKLDENSLHKCLNENPKQVYIVIGPEGGLSAKEILQLKKSGFQSIYLGKNILRTETAALYATAAINVIIMEKERWNLHRKASE